jgi:hypothetical protein
MFLRWKISNSVRTSHDCHISKAWERKPQFWRAPKFELKRAKRRLKSEFRRLENGTRAFDRSKWTWAFVNFSRHDRHRHVTQLLIPISGEIPWSRSSCWICWSASSFDLTCRFSHPLSDSITSIKRRPAPINFIQKVILPIAVPEIRDRKFRLFVPSH